MRRNQPSEKVRYVRHSALPGVELLLAEPSNHLWRMLHERYLVCGCRSVSTSWKYRGKTWHSEDGSTGLLEPGEAHQVVAKRKPSYFVAMFLESGPMMKFAEEAGISGVPQFAKVQVDSPSLLNSLYALSDSVTVGSTRLEIQSRMTLLMDETMPYTEAHPQNAQPRGERLAWSLRTAREMLRASYNENVTLDELANASALSRFHLVREFSALHGLAPHAYQIQLRIKQACKLLRAGASCAEAASAVGFADQSHLTRHFRRVMRVTPRQYRESAEGE
jgi:AraC-like DNA-binding protein